MRMSANHNITHHESLNIDKTESREVEGFCGYRSCDQILTELDLCVDAI